MIHAPIYGSEPQGPQGRFFGAAILKAHRTDHSMPMLSEDLVRPSVSFYMIDIDQLGQRANGLTGSTGPTF